MGEDQRSGEPDSETDSPTLSAEEARVSVAGKGAVVVDVRDLESWQMDRIPGSIHADADKIGEAITELSGKRELEIQQVIVVCEDGEQSADAADELRGQGDVEAVSMKGGFKAWVDAGFPLQPSGDVAEIPNPDPDEKVDPSREDSAVDPKIPGI